MNGADLQAISAGTWRCELAVVFQDFIRYPLSVRGNIALGRPERRRVGHA